MAYFIRKVSPGKWEFPLPEDQNHLNMGTDGVTGCCKTHHNTLSLWCTSNNNPDSDENKKIIVAIAASADRPATLDFIFLEDNELNAIDVEFENTPESAATPIDSIKPSHFDIKNITVDKLGKVGMLIHTKVNDDTQIHRKTSSEIKSYVRSLYPATTPDAESIVMKIGWSKVYN